MSSEGGPSISWANRLLAWLRERPAQVARWPVLQVEVTSRCLMRCSFCPNKMLGGAWQHADLPWGAYRDHLGPHLSRFDLIYLQGWGEPLLHRHLWEMVNLAKDAGSQVGFTSCGSLLTEKNIGRMFDAGIDLLSVSFAGATAATHEALRVGSDFHRLVKNVSTLAARRTIAGARLYLELHYLMMRSNIHELPAFVRLAAELGADEAVATNLTYAFTPELDSLRVFGPAPGPAHLAWVAEAQHEAEQLRIKFRTYPLTSSDTVMECDAQPTETAFINCRREVTPCVYLGMPVTGAVPRYFEGVNRPMTPVSFGRVDDGFMAAWESRSRRNFNAMFGARHTASYSMLMLAATGSDVGELPAPPEPCQHCYKMLGC